MDRPGRVKTARAPTMTKAERKRVCLPGRPLPPDGVVAGSDVAVVGTLSRPRPRSLMTRTCSILLTMAPGISLIVCIVRSPRRSGAAGAESEPLSAPADIHRDLEPMLARPYLRKKQPNAAHRVCWPWDDGRFHGGQPSQGRGSLDRVE